MALKPFDLSLTGCSVEPGITPCAKNEVRMLWYGDVEESDKRQPVFDKLGGGHNCVVEVEVEEQSRKNTGMLRGSASEYHGKRHPHARGVVAIELRSHALACANLPYVVVSQATMQGCMCLPEHAISILCTALGKPYNMPSELPWASYFKVDTIHCIRA
ncbi:hypothetical protein VTL71DRAFT_8414 [Oculimacula yallundae]|uniref:Uncharacterized protein n=1 Tax=Oculimacula yallundae TaxID=86028 RepID=A0ABR4CXN7_9HELO